MKAASFIAIWDRDSFEGAAHLRETVTTLRGQKQAKEWSDRSLGRYLVLITLLHERAPRWVQVEGTTALSTMIYGVLTDCDKKKQRGPRIDRYSDVDDCKSLVAGIMEEQLRRVTQPQTHGAH